MSAQGQGTEQIEEEGGLISEPAGFFPTARVLEAVLLLVRPIRQGSPGPLLTRVITAFIILNEVPSRVQKGSVNKTTDVNQNCLGKGGCVIPPSPRR